MITIKSYTENESGEILDESESEYSFHAVVELLSGTEPSTYPLPKDVRGVWYTYYHDQDMRSGEYHTTSYHAATDRDSRFMRLAWNCARFNRDYC